LPSGTCEVLLGKQDLLAGNSGILAGGCFK
jgi:hypothetical protein